MNTIAFYCVFVVHAENIQFTQQIKRKFSYLPSRRFFFFLFYFLETKYIYIFHVYLFSISFIFHSDFISHLFFLTLFGFFYTLFINSFFSSFFCGTIYPTNLLGEYFCHIALGVYFDFEGKYNNVWSKIEKEKNSETKMSGILLFFVLIFIKNV